MTTGIKNWSTTPGDNDSPSPNGAPEGMAPSAVNDVIRQNMSEVREWYEDASWIDFGHTGLTYVDSDSFRVTGDLTAVYHVGRRVRAIGTTPFTIYGTITATNYDSTNTTVDVTFDSGSLDNTLSEVAVGPEVTNSPISADGISGLVVASVGDFKTSAQTADHNGWLKLNSTVRNVSRTTYATLFALIGTTFGSGDGSTTFGLPPAGDTFLLNAGSTYSIGETGGAAEHTLTVDELPAHGHPYQSANMQTLDTGDFNASDGTGGLVTHEATPGSFTLTANAAFSGTVSSSSGELIGGTGGGSAHNNMPPYVVAGNAFIYSGVTS